ncbi:NADH-quinone oxidoreductase subunit I [Lacrimispora sp.]|uniref:NADH-quinone oxidoreductase subunit I n=1 Tax=Lacrimispora sp. TaxID=2719234 RepID=UPI002FDAA142
MKAVKPILSSKFNLSQLNDKVSYMSEFNLCNDGERPFPILFERKENCCGCTACYSVCPVWAISMTPDEEGFLYPQINNEKCNRCYQCLNVCAFKADQRNKGYLV